MFLLILVCYIFPAILSFTMWAALCKLAMFFEIKPVLTGLVLAVIPGINLACLGALIALLWIAILRD